jgi:hypothetical protein
MTNREAGAQIYTDHMMKAGTCGLFGPGIYFADSPEHARHKAAHDGGRDDILITADVDCGCALIFNTGDRNMTPEKVRAEGCNSIKGRSCSTAAWEYIVFEPHRISLVSTKGEIPFFTPPGPDLAGRGRTLRSRYGMYLSAQPNGRLEWNRTKADGWEMFEFIPLNGNIYNIKTYHGLYCCAERSGTMICNISIPKEWEMFTIKNLGKNCVSIQTYHGQYVTAGSDGSVSANSSIVGPCEIFSV